MNTPLISVMMANYNTELDMLKESIDSILNQTFTDFEFIIVDDCSSLEMQADTLIAEYNDDRIIYLKNEQNLGLAGSLNRALSISRGKYIARMDTDDISLPDRFEKQIKYMEKHSDIDVLSGRILFFGSCTGMRIANSLPDSEHLKALLLFECFVNHPAVMIRKSFLDRHKLLYNSNLRQAEDYDLWSRILTAGGKFAEIPAVILNYRKSNFQATTKHRDEQKRCAQYAYINQLTALNIHPSSDDLSIHEILAEGQSYNDIPLDKIILWCKRISAANKEKQRYYSFALNDILAQRLIICSKNHHTTKKDFIKIFQAFGIHIVFYFVNAMRCKIIKKTTMDVK